MNLNALFVYLAPLVALATGIAAWATYRTVQKKPEGTDLMKRLASMIRSGAMTYLKTQYRILSLFVIVVAVLLYFGINPATALAFIAGAVCSMAAGVAGMSAATMGNVRTTSAARTGLSEALSAAFGSGSVMGFAVASLGLFGVSVFYLAFQEAETPGLPPGASGHGSDKHREHSRFRYGRQQHRPLCKGRRRYLHQERRCGC